MIVANKIPGMLLADTSGPRTYVTVDEKSLDRALRYILRRNVVESVKVSPLMSDAFRVTFRSKVTS